MTKPRNRYDDDFQVFWLKFKGRWNPDRGMYVKVGKYMAQKEWRKLADDEKEHAIAVADRSGGKYTPDPERWLKRKLFDDYTVKKQA